MERGRVSGEPPIRIDQLPEILWIWLLIVLTLEPLTGGQGNDNHGERAKSQNETLRSHG